MSRRTRGQRIPLVQTGEEEEGLFTARPAPRVTQLPKKVRKVTLERLRDMSGTLAQIPQMLLPMPAMVCAACLSNRLVRSFYSSI